MVQNFMAMNGRSGTRSASAGRSPETNEVRLLGEVHTSADSAKQMSLGHVICAFLEQRYERCPPGAHFPNALDRVYGNPRRLRHDATARGGITPGWHAHPVEDLDGELQVHVTPEAVRIGGALGRDGLHSGTPEASIDNLLSPPGKLSTDGLTSVIQLRTDEVEGVEKDLPRPGGLDVPSDQVAGAYAKGGE